jgi:penicillin amidase
MTWKDSLLYPAISPILKTALRIISRTRLPQTRGTMQVKSLEAPVEVLRDRWGVAHIYGRTGRDVVFAQGFIHAQERLWQMDFTRRVVAGRLAEVLGEAALPADRAMRTLGLRQVAEQEANQAPANIHTLIEAYCTGVNAWIETAEARRKLPVEFLLLGYAPEPWQPADSMSWGKLMSWFLAANWATEFLRQQITQRLGAEKTAELELGAEKAWAVILDAGLALAGQASVDATRAFTGPHAGEGVGSNNWVIHGSRTVTGTPLLANDMHLGLSAPAIWYENHLVGGELEVAGITFPGVPLVVAGHSRHVAWGYTDGLADVQDLYEEHLRRSPEGGWEHEFKGEWLPATVRKEEIRIKGGKSTFEEVVVTNHGPIINLLFKDAFPEAHPMALRWTALEPENIILALFQMNTARDCQEFSQALRYFDGPSQNTVYADTQGNIAYSLTGKIPIRAKGDGSLPSPGWTGEYEWAGYIPFEELPHLYNPPRGYVATANNPVNRPNFPHFIARDFIASDRAGRIVEMIEAGGKLDIPCIQKMHFDQVSLSARVLGCHLGALEIADPDLRGIVSQMRSWDGKLEAGSHLATIYEVTIQQALRLLLEHHLGDLGRHAMGEGQASGLWSEHSWEWFIHLLDQPDSPWFNLGNGEQRDDVLSMALRQAVDSLKRKIGPQQKDWSWGKLHRLTFRHVLGSQQPLDAIFNLGPFGIGGDGNTIWASYAGLNLEKIDRDMTGPAYRFIADLGDLDHCWGVLAPGQSGHLASPHYADGIRPWFEAGYHPVLFDRAEVEQNLEARLVLTSNCLPTVKNARKLVE